MSVTPDSERTPAERVDDLPSILEAMGRAVREALPQHKRAGNPWPSGGTSRSCGSSRKTSPRSSTTGHGRRDVMDRSGRELA